jgi:hypothetical protein
VQLQPAYESIFYVGRAINRSAHHEFEERDETKKTKKNLALAQALPTSSA